MEGIQLVRFNQYEERNQEIDNNINNFSTQLAQIEVNVQKYYNPLETSWTPAIRRAIVDVPVGGTLKFPANSEGYLCKNLTEKYLFLVDKPMKIVGCGLGSQIILDTSIPNDTDIFYVSPSSGSDSRIRGYQFLGVCITGQLGSAPARHAIHVDVTNTNVRVANSLFDGNILYPTGGNSIKLTNPINTDGFFTTQIQRNLIFSGMDLQRCGDSVTIEENTFAGYNGVTISMVDGSNTLVFEKNNYTARQAFVIKGGHNVKVMQNNFEVGYEDASYVNSALLDIDGSDVVEQWGILALEILGNNFTYRTTELGPVDAIRINKARGARIEGNHIAHNGGYMINITPNAQNTLIGYNLYSSADPSGIINDLGTGTIKKDVHKSNPSGGRLHYEIIANEIYREGNIQHEIFNDFTKEGKSKTAVSYHKYVYPQALASNLKHSFVTARKTDSGALDNVKEVMFMDNEKVVFPSQGFGIVAVGGSTNKFQTAVAIPTSGTYARGDIVFFSSPVAGGYTGARCITAGAPGVWKQFGQIEA